MSNINNKIEFAEQNSNVKLTWKVLSNNTTVTDLDSVNMIINGKKTSLNADAKSYETQISADTKFKVEVGYNNMVASSNELFADYLEPEQPEQPDTPVTPTPTNQCYYGTLVTDIEYFDEYGDLLEWNVVKNMYDDFLATLNKETISILIDNAPIDGAVAHPNMLVSSTSIKNPNNRVYEFINKGDGVSASHTVVIYPSSYGKTSKIKNAIGTDADINTESLNGFYQTTIMLGDVEYYVYLAKQYASNETKAQLTFVK